MNQMCVYEAKIHVLEGMKIPFTCAVSLQCSVPVIVTEHNQWPRQFCSGPVPVEFFMQGFYPAYTAWPFSGPLPFFMLPNWSKSDRPNEIEIWHLAAEINNMPSEKPGLPPFSIQERCVLLAMPLAGMDR